MTTTVYDGIAKIAATDSRWSISLENAVVYVDDSNFDKIEYLSDKRLVVTFAGNASLIEVWKTWFRTGMQGSRPSVSEKGPSGEEFSIATCILSLNDGGVLFAHGQDIEIENAKFAGSGGIHAHGCWQNHKCAVRAVDSAKKLDVFSGGETKYVNMMAGEHNLNSPLSCRDMTTSFLSKGFVMYLHNKADSPVPFQEAVSRDRAMEQLAQDIASGAVVARAPCDAMFKPWTPEEEKQLDDVLARIKATD